jgi:hypothetical protein
VGRQARIAISGAVYVYVNGEGFWKPSAVPAIVRGLKQDLEKVMAPETGEAEEWGAREIARKLWEPQKGLLKQRVDQVMPVYDRLISQAELAMQRCEGDCKRGLQE